MRLPENICWIFRQKKVLEFEEALFEYIKTKYPEIPESIKETRVLSDEAEQKLVPRRSVSAKQNFLQLNKAA